MAAVMVGGMVPPIAIALSTTFCPKKWTSEERKNGFVNYIMGLCFISEGAIPFAATDPLRVLPSCVIGSAVSGALSCCSAALCGHLTAASSFSLWWATLPCMWWLWSSAAWWRRPAEPAEEDCPRIKTLPNRS